MTARVYNSGTASGSTALKLFVNGREESSRGVEVGAGSSVPVTFSMSRDEPEEYLVFVGGTAAGSFNVEATSDPGVVLCVSAALCGTALTGGALFHLRRKKPGHLS